MLASSPSKPDYYTWKGILKIMSCIRDGFRFRIGNIGKSIDLQRDTWIGVKLLQNFLIPHLAFLTDKRHIVSECIHDNK